MTLDPGGKFLTGPPFERSFEFVEHTADLAVRVRAPDAAGLFAVAAAAFTETVTNGGTVRSADERAVRLSAPDLDVLLVDWLHELLFLFETEAFLVGQAEVEITRPVRSPEAEKEDLRDLRALREEYVISAFVRGERRDPNRHPVKVLVKAITYHGLHVTRSEHGYEATIIFDI